MSYRLKILFTIIAFLFVANAISAKRTYSQWYYWSSGSCAGFTCIKTTFNGYSQTVEMSWYDCGTVRALNKTFIVIKNGKLESSEGMIDKTGKEIINVIIEMHQALAKVNNKYSDQKDLIVKQTSEKIKKIYGPDCKLTTEPPQDVLDSETDVNKIKKEMEVKLNAMIEKEKGLEKKDIKKDEK